MNWIFKIAPKQLSQIDIFLRANYPWLWATRIHLTLYMSILLALFSGAIGLLAPVDIQEPLSKSDVMDYFGIFMFPAVLFMGYIIFQLCLFSVEKRRGKGNFFRPLIVLPTLMLSITLPMIMPFTAAVVVNQKVAHLEGQEVLFNELINLSKAQYYVNEGEGSYDHFMSNKDYLEFKSKKNNSSSSYQQKINDAKVSQIYWHDGEYRNERPRLLKDASYNAYYYNRLSFDKEAKLKATRVKFYRNQNFNFSLDSARKYLNLLKDYQLKYSIGSPVKVDSILYELKNNIYHRCYSNGYISSNSSRYYDRRYHVKKIFNDVKDNMATISYAQHNFWNRNAKYILYAALCVSFGITVVLFMFKHVPWKQFLLSLLILAIYFTIAGIIEGFGRFRGNFIFTMLLVLVFFALVYMNRAWSLKKSSVFVNQMAIIAFLSIPLIPMMIVGFMDEVMDYWPYYARYYSEYGLDGEVESYSEMKERLYLTNFWIGIGLFYVLGLPYLKTVFMRLMSLPKNK